MSTNKELINKADLALSDLATAGRLSPQQADRFVRKVIDQPTLLSQARTVTMRGSSMNINKIGFGSRILSPAVQAIGAGEDYTVRRPSGVKPDLSQLSLNTKEVIAEVNIPYEVMEDNIEGGNVGVALQGNPGGIHQTIVDLIAARAALDLEELAILGDTAGSGDPYLQLQDGFLKLATANAVNVGGLFGKDAVKAGINAMPTRYLRNRAQMVNFVSVANETEMRDVYSGRQTALGDAQAQGNLPLYVFGTKVEGTALMPTASGLMTNPLNLIFGIQRDIMIEYDKDIRARMFVIVLTARIDFQIEDVNAVVKYTGITS